MTTIGTPKIIASTMHTELVKRAAGLARAESVTGHRYRVTGVLQVLGTGELVIDVTFPVRFTEHPSPSGSGFLGEGETLVAGSFPTWDVGFGPLYYDTIRGGKRLYTGAPLIVVITGPSDRADTMQSFAGWQMEGAALVNPGRATVQSL